MKVTPLKSFKNMTTNENQTISAVDSRAKGSAEVNNESGEGEGGGLFRLYDIPVKMEMGVWWG